MPRWFYLPIAARAASIFAFTASRLKLAPFCIGGNSMAVMMSFSTSLLDEHEAPEFVLEPVEVLLRPGFGPALGPARALEGIEAKVGQERHVDMGLLAEPAAGLLDEAILEVVDAHGAQLLSPK